MIEEFKKIVEEAIEKKNTVLFGSYVQELADKYGVCVKTVYNRFKSMFGESATDYIAARIYPTKAELSKMILSAETSEDVREATGLTQRFFVGIYDKYYGVSTFKAARLKILGEQYEVSYKPNREDNRSLWYSQHLGDGYYDARRHAFKISHGIKQLEYLKWKVSLINKAYPKTPTEVKIRHHSQGFDYADCHSRHIGNVDIPSDKTVVVPKLTPLGWLLWYLDDGNYSQNYSIACAIPEVCAVAIKELKTYGIKARHTGVGIQLCGHENDFYFYKNMLEPFINEIPKSMLYKVEDIVGGNVK